MAKILIADDSAFMRKVLSDILVKNEMTDISEAENGKQAIEKFDAEKPSLVLLDIIMPELDGIGVLKDVVPKGAKALVISAVGQEDMIGQAKAAGALGYVVKPFEEEQVMAEVRKILGGGAAPQAETESTMSQPVAPPTAPPAPQPAPQPMSAQPATTQANPTSSVPTPPPVAATSMPAAEPTPPPAEGAAPTTPQVSTEPTPPPTNGVTQTSASVPTGLPQSG